MFEIPSFTLPLEPEQAERLQAIGARFRASTRGKWKAQASGDTQWWVETTSEPSILASTIGGNDEANARFIAAAGGELGDVAFLLGLVGHLAFRLAAAQHQADAAGVPPESYDPVLELVERYDALERLGKKKASESKP
jgi:hypothetical protein